jgi:subtilase family serine protease
MMRSRLFIAVGAGLLSICAHALAASKPVAADLGPAANSTPVSLTVALQLRNPDQALSLMQSLYRPGSPQFRHFLTTAEFYKQFGPTADTIASVTKHFQAAGFNVVQSTGTHLTITGSAAAVQAEFGIALHTFEAPATAENAALAFRAPLGTPKIAASIAEAVSAVVGFDTMPRYRPKLRHAVKQPATIPLAATPDSSGTSNPPGELLVTDFAQYYDVDPLYRLGLNGKGKTIGIVTFASFTPKDAFAYWTAAGLSVASNRIKVIDVDGGSGPISDVGGSDETTLDVEQSGGISTGAKIDVYEAPNTSQGFVDDFAKVVDANVADTISCSWGSWEFFDTLTTNPEYGSGPVTDPTTGRTVSVLKAVNDVLLQGALQGQSMYIASGDAGAYDMTDYYTPPSYPPPKDSVALSVDDPGVQTWATDVGGTTLPGKQIYEITKTKNLTINIPTEQAWGWDYLLPLCKALELDPISCGIYSGGSGGGVSSFVAKPFYQEGVEGIAATEPHQTLYDFSQSPPAFVVTLPSGYEGRNVPDIALNADPETGYLLFYTSSASGFGIDSYYGGTSFAAPQMNGVTALFDEAIGHRVGLLNSTLYDLVRDGHAYSGREAPLRDIKAGDNWYYKSATGYDQTTGVGVPDFAKLLEALVDQAKF